MNRRKFLQVSGALGTIAAVPVLAHGKKEEEAKCVDERTVKELAMNITNGTMSISITDDKDKTTKHTIVLMQWFVDGKLSYINSLSPHKDTLFGGYYYTVSNFVVRNKKFMLYMDDKIEMRLELKDAIKETLCQQQD